MTKNTAKKPKTDAMLALRLDANGIAELLGLGVARVHQLRREGGLKPAGDGLYSVVDALRAHYLYDSPRGEALRARTRHTNARALEIEQSVRRAQRRMLTLDELSGFAVLMFESAMDSYQAESSRFYHQFRQTHDEQESLITTHRFYEPLRLIAQGWNNGIFALIDQINRDHLPDDARLDRVLAKIIGEIDASNRADAKRLSTPTPA
jgi:hypothetical protein